MFRQAAETWISRACWETVHQLPAGWKLWHPLTPGRAQGLLEGLGSISPRTAVWLNEVQCYLLTSSEELGEQLATALHDVLQDRQRGPVLVVGTLWPEYWHAMTAHPKQGTKDLHGQARALLASHGITVPEVFDRNALTARRQGTATP